MVYYQTKEVRHTRTAKGGRRDLTPERPRGALVPRQDRQPLGTYELPGTFDVDASGTAVSGGGGSAGFPLEIRTRGAGQYVLRAETAMERDAWAAALRDVARRKRYTGSPTARHPMRLTAVGVGLCVSAGAPLATTGRPTAPVAAESGPATPAPVPMPAPAPTTATGEDDDGNAFALPTASDFRRAVEVCSPSLPLCICWHSGHGVAAASRAPLG
jgi:hypothetical protein